MITPAEVARVPLDEAARDCQLLREVRVPGRLTVRLHQVLARRRAQGEEIDLDSLIVECIRTGAESA